MFDLTELVNGFAAGIESADAHAPVASSARSERSYRPGIGPHSETQVVQLVTTEWKNSQALAGCEVKLQCPYPNMPRKRCDLLVGNDNGGWAIEVKMARFKGDNGKPSDEMIMHLISPYESDRSALTDCQKLRDSGFARRKAILIYGFNFPDKPLDPAIEAFECLSKSLGVIGPRIVRSFDGLIHPIHREGRVFGWELLS